MEHPLPTFPVPQNLLLCFAPRGPYYTFMNILYKQFNIDGSVLDSDEKIKKFDEKLQQGCPEELYKCYRYLKGFRNFVTHTFDNVTEAALRKLVYMTDILIKGTIWPNTIESLSIINKIAIDALESIPQHLNIKSIMKPQECPVGDLKAVLFEEIKGKTIEILTGRHTGQRGVFTGWNGTGFKYKLYNDDTPLYKGSTKTIVRVFW